jgi:hypothetical protein
MVVPAFAHANEPIVPIMILLAGPGPLGLFFGGIGFFVVVGIKIWVFFWKSDFRSPHIIWYVFFSNIISTIIGAIVAVMFTSSYAFLPGGAILYLIFLIPARRLRQFKPFARTSSYILAFGLLFLTYITVVAFGVMSGNYATPYVYWPLKILMATLGVGISLIISVLYEEAIIAGMHKRRFKQVKSFVQPVLWGNIIALGIFMLIGAAIALPQRLRSPDFLIYLINLPKTR